MLILVRLFYEFFKTGLFAIGGGLATMPFLYNISESTGWFSRSDLTNMIAVSESTPGPLGVNMATYVGFSVSGIPGGIIATLGLVCPAVVIIIIISKFLNKFKENPYVEAVFHKIRPTSTGLSALMTTTVQNMKDTIKAIRESGIDAKVIVGGAVLTEEYAKKIDADYYAKDAKSSVEIAKLTF